MVERLDDLETAVLVDGKSMAAALIICPTKAVDIVNRETENIGESGDAVLIESNLEMQRAIVPCYWIFPKEVANDVFEFVTIALVRHRERLESSKNK
jgi:hypothetical protein